MIYVIAENETQSLTGKTTKNSIIWKEKTKPMQNQTQSACMNRMIGGIVYKVRIHFHEDHHEKMEDKILRMIRNDLELSEKERNTGCTSNASCGTIQKPQMNRAA